MVEGNRLTVGQLAWFATFFVQSDEFGKRHST